MPPANLVKIVLYGTLTGGEIWETGFWMTDTGVNSAETATAQAHVIAGTLNSEDDSGAMRITAIRIWDLEVKWVGVRCYGYNGGPTATWVGDFPLDAPRQGQAPGGPLPHQVCACMTLLTGLAGRSQRGRMYLPATGVSLDSGGQMTHPSIDPVVASWAKAFTDINASDAGKIVVYSRTRQATHQVRSVRIDSVPDIQRRRANGLQANYQQAATVTP